MISLQNNLKGKTAVITGGAGVLCSTFARGLAALGVKVAILDLAEEPAYRLAKEIKEQGGEAIAIKCNVLNKEEVIKAKEEVLAIYGSYELLINGAGGNHPKGTTNKEVLEFADLNNYDQELITFFDLEEKGFEFVFNLNFMGTFIPTQVFAREMVGKSGATIINISSMSAFAPMTKVPAYSAAKAAISNFTQWMAVHLAEVGIRVNAIAPGFFLTEQNRKLLQKEDGTPTERCQKIISQTPMRRLGKPEDLLGTLFWLCDEKASGFVTGVVIPVDGGFMAYSGV